MNLSKHFSEIFGWRKQVFSTIFHDTFCIIIKDALHQFRLISSNRPLHHILQCDTGIKTGYGCIIFCMTGAESDFLITVRIARWQFFVWLLHMTDMLSSFRIKCIFSDTFFSIRFLADIRADGKLPCPLIGIFWINHTLFSGPISCLDQKGIGKFSK